MNNSSTRMRCAAKPAGGYTLVEVLVGMIIFAFGILALTQLQGNLAKSSADSNARTVAVNLAEEIIESARTFRKVPSGGGVHSFNDIVPVPDPYIERRGGVDYSITHAVDDYYYVPATSINGNPTFSKNKPDASTAEVDMKLLTVNVTWGGAETFQIDNVTDPASLGTGSITLTDMISSITSPSGGKILLNKTTSSLYGPPVDYSPGSRPDIISIQLGENRFKESTTPLPDVIRTEDLVETTFDVVTYSQSDSGATFLRREEFRAVSCECTLRASTQDTEGGLRPTLWNGTDYTEGEFVAKAYGESANNQQSTYCNICCRDHHDGGTAENDDANDPGRGKYSPFKPAGAYWQAADGNNALLGDHKHYAPDRSGNMVVAEVGDVYEEACRLVRKDGFFRVAQDLRQEGLNSFPAAYLDEPGEIDEYSQYVTESVNAFESAAVAGYEASPPSLTLPVDMSPAVVFPASSLATASLMTSVGLPSQQLRARGIYIDYITDELRAILDCMDAGGTGSSCGVGGANSVLEVIPFYDVQVTWLSRWNESPDNLPIDVTNETVADDNAHSRGMARILGTYGSSEISTHVHRGNLGLTATGAIDPWYASDLKNYKLYATANVVTTPPASGYTVKGQIISGVSGLKATDAEISVTVGQCDRTSVGFECTIPVGASNPRITISKYFKRNKDLYACSDVMSINGTSHSGDIPANNWTRFNLPATQNLLADVIIKENSCL